MMKMKTIEEWIKNEIKTIIERRMIDKHPLLSERYITLLEVQRQIDLVNDEHYYHSMKTEMK